MNRHLYSQQIILWLLLLITTPAQPHKVVESTEDIDPPTINVTTLYPVSNISIINKSIASNKSEIPYLKENEDAITSMNTRHIKKEIADGDNNVPKKQHFEEETIMKDESSNEPDESKYIAKDVNENEYMEPKVTLQDEHVIAKDDVYRDKQELKENYVFENENNKHRNKETRIIGDETVKIKTKGTTSIHATSWKLETAFAESDSEKERNCHFKHSEEKEEEPGRYYINNESSNEFKPSQPLGSFFDDEVSVSDSYEPFTPIIQRPTTEFVSFPKHEHRPTFSDMPREMYESYTEFPYKFEYAENLQTTDSWKPPDSSGPRPSAVAPGKVPAGGLYKLTNPFQDKPAVYDDETFGLNTNGDVRENHIKKRVNPWQNLLRLMTAFIPVGLIISALTPNVITVQPANSNPRPVNLYRRSDGDAGDIPPISERCRRRLLCELHSDHNYQPQSPQRRRGKQCYRIYCDDPHALQRVLRWLLHRQPGVGDHRGRHVT